MSHSPAPWAIEETERHAGRGGGLRIVDASRGYVASLLSYERRRFSEEREDDAHLIAAAPDMLDVLKAIRDQVRRRCNQQALDAVDIAIAKAEGK